MLAVKLLGQFVIEREGEPVELLSRPAQALLAYLLLHPHTKTRRERLGGLLWPDATDRNARANLRQTLWRLRKAVGDELFVADKIAIGLNPDVAYTLDVDRLTSVSADSPLPDLIDGVSAFGGPLLPDFYDDWVAPERERLQGLFDERVRTLIRRLEADGRWQEVLEWGECWIALNHAPEPAFRALMRAYAALGDAAGIATAYARCAARLELDLGLEPSEETQALYAQLAGEDWSPPPTRSPYRGLYAFRPEDARYFFGRETFVAHLLEAVREHPLTAVVGPSGSGKSSVVFAGLLPQLQSSDGWQVITFRPGAQPLRALTAALNGTGASARADASLVDVLAQRANGDSAPPLLLVADQFEELYTLVPGRPARREFLDALLGAVEWARDRPDSRFRCVITLRADFMGRALAYRPLADALQRADVKLGPMTREELGRAIVQPAATLGVTFEPGLVERILDDVGQEPGNLPLLEFALAQLWERQARRKLTHDSYEATGRVEGALARHAEDVYAAMDADTRARARQVFVQLVQPGEQTEDTRRVATRDELGDDWLLARQLADSRLVVTGRNAAGQEVAEVAHEALIRNWDRLRGWMEADRTFRAWQERLRAALRQWEASTYDEGALLRGVPLAEAQGWLAERGDELSSDERAYIRASAELQQARQSARDRRRRRTIFGLTAGLALAVALAIVAGVSWRESVRDERAALEAYSLSLSAIAQEALNDLDTATALVIAQAANSVDDPPPLAQRTLLEAAYAPGVRAYFDLAAMVGSEGEEVRSVDLSRDGSVAVAGLTDGTVAFFDPESGTLLASTRAHDYPVNGVLVSPGGDIAVSISVDSRVILWDMQTYQQLRQLEGHSSTVRAVDFNADGTHLLTGGLSSESAETPGELILWDVATGSEIRRYTNISAGVEHARFVPDGVTMLVDSGGSGYGAGGTEEVLAVYDVATGALLHQLDLVHEGELAVSVAEMAVSPDGTFALVASSDANIYQFDLATGELQNTFTGHPSNVTSVAISADGRRAVSGGLEGQTILWDLTRGIALAKFAVHDGFVTSTRMDSGGIHAISSAFDGTVAYYDLSDAALLRRIKGHGSLVLDIVFSATGDLFLASSGSLFPDAPFADNTVRVWDTATGRQLQILEGHTNSVYSVALSPDEKTALTGSADQSVRLWDLETGAELRRFDGHANWVTEVAITPDGRYGISGSTGNSGGTDPVGGALFVWDLETGEMVRELDTLGVWSMSLSPDGSTLVSGGVWDNQHVFDLQSGVELFQLESAGAGLAFVPDGASVVYAGFGGGLTRVSVSDGTILQRYVYDNPLRTRPSISADGKYLLSSDISGFLNLWDLETGTVLRRYGTFNPGLTMENAISPDGTRALVALDNDILEWDLTIPSLADLRAWIAANRYVRDLTCEERELYQIEPLCAEL